MKAGQRWVVGRDNGDGTWERIGSQEYATQVEAVEAARALWAGIVPERERQTAVRVLRIVVTLVNPWAPKARAPWFDVEAMDAWRDAPRGPGGEE